MPRSIVVEGKTTQEAIEKGLKELKVSKNMVNIKTLEEEKKRSFYSILAPRVVRVELTVKEGAEEKEEERSVPKHKREINTNMEEIQQVSEKIKELFSAIVKDDLVCDVTIENYSIFVRINGEDVKHLIGYRGATINALQTVASAVANRYSKTKIVVIVDVGGYRDKRAKDLEVLAENMARRVIKTGRSITLDPMTAYERKVIHTKLQENEKIKTFSKGEEPHRRIVIALV